MKKVFEPDLLEKKWYAEWETSGYFSPSSPEGPAYTIALPPPNVTGTLHMGHAFQDTLMDVLIRYHRMNGHHTLWQPGTDHAGIATQMVVERRLQAEGQTRHDLGREAFIDKIWEWKNQSGNAITQQMRRLGASADWSRERFTMDEGLSKAVQTVFIQLFEEGLIYRGQRLVNWDPVLKTAVSDLEVINEEAPGKLVYIRYPIVGEDDAHITVATTRPETLFGDVAVAVNPEDERYAKWIGKNCWLPLQEKEIPIIADEEVLPDFGTGCVKITPAHDFTDNAIGARHGLEMINILTPEATLNEKVPADFQGLDRYVARQRVIEALEKLALLDKIEDYQIKTPKGDRTGEVLEPYLTDQWFVKTAPLAEPAIKAVESGEIRFVPKNWENTYFEWMRNIQDWCISRQLWWGHRIPAWYDEAGNCYVAASEDEARQKYNLDKNLTLTQDNDVLDTWFSSALWPFSTLGWPDKTPELETFYPTQVLVTGFDIIFFWVARMIMFGLKFMDQKPFSEVYVHGLIQDSHGQKMSKSKGNVIDPIDLIDGIDLEPLVKKRTSGLMQPQMAKKIEKQTRKDFPEGISAYGTDAVRFTFCALASTTRHIRFELPRVEGYRNFMNKLWNAARFALMQMPEPAVVLNENAEHRSVADRWILSELQSVIKQSEEAVSQYRFDLLAKLLYEFTWNQFCDWYLELAKATLQSSETTDLAREATQHTIVNVLNQICKLLHPITPYITEEIAEHLQPYLSKEKALLMVCPYPKSSPDLEDTQAVAEVTFLKESVIGIRNIRGELNISPAKTIPVVYLRSKQPDNFNTISALFQKLTKIESLEWLADSDMPPASATALAQDLSLFVPLAGLINIEEELERTNKSIKNHQKELEKLSSKLSNERFISKAPPSVVEEVKGKQAKALEAIQKLEETLERLKSL